MSAFQRREHSVVARRLFFKNISDGRNDDAAAADAAKFGDGLRKVAAPDNDADRVPALIGLARDDGADGGTLQAANGCLGEQFGRDRFGTFAAHVRYDEEIFLRPKMRFDVLEQTARHF